MAQYLTAQEAKQMAEESMGLLDRALRVIENSARQGRLEDAYGSTVIAPSIVQKLRELGYVVQPEGRTTHVSWK
jgi:hypothetical protein